MEVLTYGWGERKLLELFVKQDYIINQDIEYEYLLTQQYYF